MTDRSQQHRELADAFNTARRTGEPIVPPRETLEGMEISDAYAVQLLQEADFVGSGDPVVGRKIGLTSLAMQKQLSVDQPDFGFVTESMTARDNHRFAAGEFISPKVEPELGLVLAKDLRGPGVTLEQAIDAVASVHAAIEIIDSRVADWNIRLVDTIADNASCGAIAYASEAMDVEVSATDKVECSLKINGEVVANGTGADVMGHPAEPLAWLANVLGEQGVTLKAGEVVLTGSFTGAVAVEPGTSATADFGDLGSITIHF
ncbi:fumarylacetoacetate hydrolase family protein [Mariniluteicoccus endophyticus]